MTVEVLVSGSTLTVSPKPRFCWSSSTKFHRLTPKQLSILNAAFYGTILAAMTNVTSIIEDPVQQAARWLGLLGLTIFSSMVRIMA